uniref:Uncharacterized protein n=1 Tax=Cucumis melo TaxID=3656 RepID=A0A9I9DT83_CUCME
MHKTGVMVDEIVAEWDYSEPTFPETRPEAEIGNPRHRILQTHLGHSKVGDVKFNGFLILKLIWLIQKVENLKLSGFLILCLERRCIHANCLVNQVIIIGLHKLNHVVSNTNLGIRSSQQLHQLMFRLVIPNTVEKFPCVSQDFVLAIREEAVKIIRGVGFGERVEFVRTDHLVDLVMIWRPNFEASEGVTVRSNENASLNIAKGGKLVGLLHQTLLPLKKGCSSSFGIGNEFKTQYSSPHYLRSLFSTMQNEGNPNGIASFEQWNEKNKTQRERERERQE